MRNYTKDDLVHLHKSKDTLVGIDSDGCVFDTMDVKQKNHFHPLIIKMWGLEAIEKEVRAVAEFVNLYSKWRGSNRFVALLKVFELLRDWPDAVRTGVEQPPTESLRAYVESGLPLGNPSLADEVQRTGDPELERLYRWSLAINKDIDEHMEAISPFEGVRACLDKMSVHSDILVVSQTPEEALVKEWDLHGISHHVDVIAGQELGTKAEHLEMAKDGRWEGGRVLMVGDAPGDRKAAEAVGAAFYPILPGDEEASWQRLHEEAYDRFRKGAFAGDYQAALNESFEARLPERPPWMP